MPPRPFPYQFGVGTDIARISRIESVLFSRGETNNHNNDKAFRFLRHLLTPLERHELSQRFRDIPKLLSNKDGGDGFSRHVAGRWAAKEAVIKAVEPRRLTFHDIVIIPPKPQSKRLCAVILDRATSGQGDQKTTLVRSGSGVERVTYSGQNDDEALDKVQSLELLDASERLSITTQSYGQLSGQIAKLSITHDGDYAAAVCIAAEDPVEGDVGGEAAARELTPGDSDPAFFRSITSPKMS